MSPILINVMLGEGRITFDEFPIDLDQPLRDQIDLLQEDLIQIEFPKKIVVDVGWYPSWDPSGHFQVVVVRDGDWKSPLLFMQAKDLSTLALHIHAAIQEANNISIG